MAGGEEAMSLLLAKAPGANDGQEEPGLPTWRPAAWPRRAEELLSQTKRVTLGRTQRAHLPTRRPGPRRLTTTDRKET